MPDVTSGLVVRGLSSDGAFAKEEVDADRRLLHASVSAQAGNRDVSDVAKYMPRGNYKKGFAVTTAEKIIRNGGRVIVDKQVGNPNHCVIFGLSVKDANNLFSEARPWTELPVRRPAPEAHALP